MRRLAGWQVIDKVFLLAAAILIYAGQSARADLVLDWGYSFLGDGVTYGSSAPVAVSGLSSGVTAVAAGVDHSLAVQNGVAYAWGENEEDQLGNSSILFYSNTPVPVTGLTSGVTAVAGGYFHSLALQNGGVYAWGYNPAGEIGDGTTSARNTPVPVSGLSSGVTAIAAGSFHSLAVQNGEVYAWGDNTYGDIGDGTTTERDTPVPVTGLSSGVTAFAGGYLYSLAIQNGGVYAWGYNPAGEIGDGTTTNRLTPEAVTGLSSSVTAIAAGGFHSLAVKNGSVYAWGDDTYGQLGDSGVGSLSPEQIDPTDLKNIIAVAAGDYSSYALSSDGSLWVWGDNSLGELGLGTNPTDYATPQHLLPPSGYVFTSIDASVGDGTDGTYHAVATLAPVPEPSTFVLAVLALGLVMARRRLS